MFGNTSGKQSIRYIKIHKNYMENAKRNWEISNIDDYVKMLNENDGSFSVFEVLNKYSNVRKKQVFNYINSLKLNSAQKSFLYKKAGYSNTNTKNTIIKYIDSFDISKAEKNELYNYLY